MRQAIARCTLSVAVLNLILEPVALAMDGNEEALQAPPNPIFNESGGDRQVLRFNDLSAQQGMAPPAGHGGFATNRSLLRGFENQSTLRNGYRDFGYLGQESGAGDDGAEVFKGAASALYGNGKPGGDINVLARRPDGVRHRDVQLSVSRFGHVTTMADVGNALGNEGQGAFRLGLVSEWGSAYRKFDGDDILGIAPSLALNLSGGTRLLLEGDIAEVNDHTQPLRLPLPEVVSFPGKLTLGEASDRLRSHGRTWRGTIDHVLSEGWRWRNALFYQQTRSNSQISQLDVFGWTGDSVLFDDGHFARRVTEQRQRASQALVLQSELYGRFTALGANHQWLTGVELGRYLRENKLQRAPLAPLNLLTPSYGASASGPFTMVGDQRSGFDTQVVYMQDRLGLGPSWQALFGLRVQRMQGWSDNHLSANSSRGDDVGLSPRVGLVNELQPGVSLYGSLTQSSVPQLGATTANATLLPPEKSGQLEIGIQWGRSDTGLLGTLATYQLRKSQIATTDPANPQFSMAAGEQQSQGLELTLRGQAFKGVTWDASFETLRAYVVKDNDVPSGTSLPGVAPWFVSSWLTAQVAAGWTVGWGLVAEGRRRAAWPPNELRLPAYVTTDLSIAYSEKAWRAQISIGNALGARAILSDGYAVSFVAPRTVTASLSLSL